MLHRNILQGLIAHKSCLPFLYLYAFVKRIYKNHGDAHYTFLINHNLEFDILIVKKAWHHLVILFVQDVGPAISVFL